MSDTKRGLGRGLSALLGDLPGESVAVTAAVSNGAAIMGLRTLPVTALRPGKYQPRRHFDNDAIADLATSLRTKGMLQPILARKHPIGRDNYEIVAGERRWRAAQAAGLHEVPVIVRALTDAEALEVALVENLQREDLSPLEEGEAYRRLMDEFGHTQEALAEQLGKSRSYVANTLRLLTLPEPVREMLEKGELTVGHARALLASVDPLTIALRVVAEGLTVRETEALVRAESQPRRAARAKKTTNLRDPDIRALERDLAAALGLEVKLKVKGKGGELLLRYSTLDQLDAVIKKLGAKR